MKKFFSQNIIILLVVIITLTITAAIAISESKTNSSVFAETRKNTTIAINNNSDGLWMNLGMEGVSTGAIAISPDYSSDHTIFINTSKGIFKSTNAGHTWVKMTNGLPLGNLNYDVYNASIAISPNYSIDKTIFINTPSSSEIASNGIYQSKDRGETWQQVNIELGDSIVPQIAFSPNYKNDHTIFIGGDGDIPGKGFFAKSTNNGSSWQIINILPDYSYWLISDFAFSPNYSADQTIFAAGTVGDESSKTAAIIKSIDGGQTWDLMIPFNNPGSNSWSIAVSPNFANDHTVFVGTDITDDIHQLIKTTDGGITWQPASTDLPTTDIQDIAISSNGIVYIGTGGDNAAYISFNHGSSWQPLTGTPDNKCGAFYSLILSPQYIQDGTIYAGCGTPETTTSGVWKHVLKNTGPPSKDNAILSPFNNGVTWTVVSGYYNNPNQTESGCHIGLGPDHCRNQLFALDIVPDQQNDTQILAPANGHIAFRGKLPEENCIGMRITLDNGANMNVCHFANYNVRQGDRILRGKVLGTRSTTHVHLSMDDRYRIGTLCPGAVHCYLPIPFDDQHKLEGMSLAPNPNGQNVTLPYPLCEQRKVTCQFKVDFQQYQSLQGTSTNVAIP